MDCVVRLACCGVIETLEGYHCTGVMELYPGEVEFVCDTCFGRCGAWAHQCEPEGGGW